jgi:hypothetical protein
MVSANRLRGRRSDFPVGWWILDSGAFTEISKYGEYRYTPEVYVEEINRWTRCGRMVAAVSQDYMCEPFIVARTGKTVEEHQRLTVERYKAIREGAHAYVMPVLQGYSPLEYVDHIEMYGDLLRPRAWVGVGSVCKRNGSPAGIAHVLSAIKIRRPDLRLHGFGLKATSLKSPYIRSLLHSADSMAWSFAARKAGRDANAWQEAVRFEAQINGLARRAA